MQDAKQHSSDAIFHKARINQIIDRQTLEGRALTEDEQRAIVSSLNYLRGLDAHKAPAWQI